MDQYSIIPTVSFFQFVRALPALITLLNDSNPKHQYPRGGPYLKTSRARCERKWCFGRFKPLYSGTWSNCDESRVSFCYYSPPSLALTCEKRPERGGTELRSKEL